MKKIVIIVALVCGAWQQADAQYVSKVWVSDQKDGTYINPIIHADYSDPDVCAVGDDFYMTASSFGCNPGIAHSSFKGFGQLAFGKLCLEGDRADRLL